ncbi:transcription termination factor NusA [Candidatus Collierbacteria bacterium RIFOXYD1_FULL_40_9]|uniref:Transcription termination/antitermination protein NusA n=1 Tax=Candidatus Collierbacteria bacterium RIFOXYD1_FULL_40_9 TaxID=1817731 RepID=A0A1F5FUS0_9BACT|nr:MAG: transcription termination factor NusA [Candidatus Collierbacteria bacterium RIFOXYD1_FULL_40_9]
MDSNSLNARTEFAAAINQICAERGIPVDTVLTAINSALVASFKKDYPEQALKFEEDELVITADIDSENGQFRLFVGKEDASKKDRKEITPPGFGRIAAQAAKQVIFQTIREAERDAILSEYADLIGKVVTGMVQRMDGRNVVVDLGRGQAVIPVNEQVPGEFYRLNSRISVYLKEIIETPKGKQIIGSRSDERLLAGLFEREVPEVSAGSVVIRAIAREAGSRSKVAVESTQPGVDPVGSCVGQKGVRVQAVINDLNNEKIDIIQFAEDKDKFIKAALAPADGLDISFINGETVVTVPKDQLSLAIGRGGQNVKLAARLTGSKIRIVSDSDETKELSIVTSGDEEYQIDQLDLDTKTRNLLVEAGLLKIEDLSDEKLDGVKGIGPKTLEKIKVQLASYKN